MGKLLLRAPGLGHLVSDSGRDAKLIHIRLPDWGFRISDLGLRW